MKVSGYQIREQLHQFELKLKTLNNQFKDSLNKFEGETKPSPQSVDEQIVLAERAIGVLQEAQAKYNLQVTGDVGGQKMTLCMMVKCISGAGHREKMWREVAAPTKDRYSSRNEDERDPSKQYSKPQITPEVAAQIAGKAGKYAGQMRAAMATANSVIVDLELDPKLFE